MTNFVSLVAAEVAQEVVLSWIVYWHWFDAEQLPNIATVGE